MPKIISIIYDFNGYKDPGIKDVKVSRVNGYIELKLQRGKK